MKYLSTINMSSSELKKQLKFLSVKVGCKQDIEVEKWGSGFFVELELNQANELFFVTAKQNIYNSELDFIYKKMVWELHTINVHSHEISEQKREFDIDLSKNRVFINDEFVVFHCTNYIDQINNELFKQNQVLYFLTMNALNLLPKKGVIENALDVLDLNLFSEVNLVGYLSHNYELLTANLVVKKTEISSEVYEKIDDKEIVLLDSGLSRLSYGSLAIKFNENNQAVSHILLGILTGYESVDIKIEDKTIELPNGYTQITCGYKIIDFIFNKVLQN